MLIIKKASLFFALFMQTVKIIRLLVLKPSTRNTKSGQKHSYTRADTKGGVLHPRGLVTIRSLDRRP